MPLDQQMTRYFEYMKPRYANPTYFSSNVGSSLGMIQSPTQPQRSPIRISKAYESEVPAEQNNNTPLQRKDSQTKLQSSKHKKSHSNLSNYGTSSLTGLPKFLNERDIYEKQQKKYNIISIQPKENKETIKRYPKLHLQNLDQNYYKKLQLQNEYEKYYDPNMNLPQRQHHHQRPVQERNPHINPENKSEIKSSFRPKMLNNVDELGGVL